VLRRTQRAAQCRAREINGLCLTATWDCGCLFYRQFANLQRLLLLLLLKHKFICSFSSIVRAGKWAPAISGKTFDTYNPATGDVLSTVAHGDAKDVDAAVKAARAAFEDGPWRKMTPSERGKVVWRIGELITKHADELAELESLDNGKPRAVARVADVALAADLFQYMAGWATKIHGRTFDISVPYAPGAKFHASTHREAIGVVGQIIPWNFPLLMAAWKLGPALAAGNTVVLKPAEQTPLTALRLGEIMLEAGLPAVRWRVLTCRRCRSPSGYCLLHPLCCLLSAVCCLLSSCVCFYCCLSRALLTSSAASATPAPQ
jgi:hypothetical protein